MYEYEVGDQFRILTYEECVQKFGKKLIREMPSSYQVEGNEIFIREFGIIGIVVANVSDDYIRYNTENFNSGINIRFCHKIDIVKDIDEILRTERG